MRSSLAISLFLALAVPGGLVRADDAKTDEHFDVKGGFFDKKDVAKGMLEGIEGGGEPRKRRSLSDGIVNGVVQRKPRNRVSTGFDSFAVNQSRPKESDGDESSGQGPRSFSIIPSFNPSAPPAASAEGTPAAKPAPTPTASAEESGNATPDAAAAKAAVSSALSSEYYKQIIDKVQRTEGQGLGALVPTSQNKQDSNRF